MNENGIVSIFLVDGNSTFLCIVKRFLLGQDALEVVGATCCGEEALGQIRALQPDLVLIDPFEIDATGLEDVAHIRQAVPEAGIIVTTLLNADGSREGYRRAVLGVGADDFVSKDTLASDLLPAIHRILDGNGHTKRSLPSLRLGYAAA